MLKHPFEHQLSSALKQYNYFVQKDYLNNLNCATLCHCTDEQDSILLFKINKFSASTTSNFFTYVFNALATLTTTIGFILENTNGTLNFYVGLDVADSTTISSEIFVQGFLATFPDSEITSFSQQDSKNLLSDLLDPDNFSAITSTIVIPNNTDSTISPILQHLTALLTSENYVALFLANPMGLCENEDLLDTLTCLFNTLSQFQQANLNCFKGVAHNKSCTLATNQSSSCSKSCTNTDNCSHGSSAAAYTNISPSTSVPLGDSCRTVNISTTFNHAASTNQGTSHATANCNTIGCSEGNSESKMDATNLTDNTTIIYSKQNKIAMDALARLTALIARLTANSNNPLFSFSAFFLAPLTSTSIRAGYTYAGLAKDPTLNLEPAFVTTWSSNHAIYLPLLNNLKHFHIPHFNLPCLSKSFKACTPITSTELLNTFYKPSS